MKFKFYSNKINENRFSDYFADRVFKVSQHLNFDPKLVILRIEDDGEFYAHFITGGKLKSTKSGEYSETCVMDFSKFVEDRKSFKVEFKNNYFEFKNQYGTKYLGHFKDDIVDDLRNVEFVRHVMPEY